MKRYRETVDHIVYYQERNRLARMCHARTRVRRLRGLGIHVEQLESCIPDEL